MSVCIWLNGPAKSWTLPKTPPGKARYAQKSLSSSARKATSEWLRTPTGLLNRWRGITVHSLPIA
jgi:hypothetical protein